MGSSPARQPKRYRSRKPIRAVLLAVALSAVAGLVWAGVLRTDQPAAGCQTTVAPGRRLPFDGLDGVPPAPPQQVRVQVLNANGTVGEATTVSGGLSELGFAPTDTAANDPLYPAFDLRCHGEIRFGVAGRAAARTLSLALPCADLVLDARPDSTVELALGTRFTDLRPNAAARQALQELAQLTQPTPVTPSQGGLTAQTRPRSPTPFVASILLDQARQAQC